jgi:hypothetical protein
MTDPPQPTRFKAPPTLQQVRWGPVDSLPAGIRAWDESNSQEEFVPWTQLKSELEQKLLPQLRPDSRGYTFEIRDYNGKKDWLVEIFDPNGQLHCDVWFGPNPDANWEFDGLVRVGDPLEPPYVWMAFRRCSDGTYRKIYSASGTIDEMSYKIGPIRRPPFIP